MTYENYIKAKLVSYVAEVAYQYGGVEPMLAVAQVLKNRVDAGWSGGDWLAVIGSAPDFEGTTPKPSMLFNPRDLNFRRVLSQIDDIYHGTADDGSVNNENQRSLYYAELHNVDREWFRTNILQDLKNHTRIAQVDQLTFFA